MCWRSGKVQLNSGIIERRYQNWDKAEAHFRLARVGCCKCVGVPMGHSVRSQLPACRHLNSTQINPTRIYADTSAAQEADVEGFCEPDFHIGLTLLGSK